MYSAYYNIIRFLKIPSHVEQINNRISELELHDHDDVNRFVGAFVATHNYK